MKIQVRSGVFETNSSSTHAISSASNIDDAWKQIQDCLRKTYEDQYESGASLYNTPESFIDEDDYGKTLKMSGFETEFNDGGNVFTIVRSWHMKLQYLAMMIRGFDVPDVIEYFRKNKETFGVDYYCSARDRNSIEKVFSESKIVTGFKKYAMETYSKHGIRVDAVEFKHDDTQKTSETNDGLYKMMYDNFGNTEMLRKIYDMVMEDSYVIIDSDCEYNPYNGSKIEIV